MTWLDAALEETALGPDFDSLETFRSHIDPEWIEDALKLSGKATMRKRRLPADQVLWLVLGMAMMRDRPIEEVATKLELVLPDREDKTIAKSSIAQARQRLGDEPVRWLFERCSKQWAHESAAKHRWRGLAVYGVDGTTMRVPDSDPNREHFGLAPGYRADSGYPLARVVVLMTLRSHLLAAAKITPYTTSELACAEALWSEIPNDSLTLVDRNYLAARVLVGLRAGGENRHWLTRAKSNSKWTVLESLGPKDDLIEVKVSSEARRKDPSLPKSYVARAIGYRHPSSKGQQWLLTSLTDSDEYPAAELVELYHERWELEIGYDEVKTHMLEREEAIRSRTVTGVYQELWGILLAFNLVRLEMEKIAEEVDVPPSRISFMAALRLIRDEWMWSTVTAPGSIPKKLRRMRDRVAACLLPPRRSDRRFRREVKIKMSKFPKKPRGSSTKAQRGASKAKRSRERTPGATQARNGPK